MLSADENFRPRAAPSAQPAEIDVEPSAAAEADLLAGAAPEVFATPTPSTAADARASAAASPPEKLLISIEGFVGSPGANRVSERTASEVYEAFEPLVNAHRVSLLDVPVLEQQLLGLVWRGGKITHQSGEHDDYAVGAAGALLAAATVSTWTEADRLACFKAGRRGVDHDDDEDRAVDEGLEPLADDVAFDDGQVF